MKVKEPEMWHRMKAAGPRVSLAEALAGPMLGITIAVTLMNSCTMFAWWALNTWAPSFLRSTGLSNASMTGFLVVMQLGMWLGYVSFGYVSDHFGRKRSYVTYLLL